MAFTFLALKTKLTTQIGDPNLDSTVMGDALNYTQQHLFETFDLTLNSAIQTNALATSATTLTSALPTDFERISSLYITSPIALARDITSYFVPIKRFRESFISTSQLSPNPPSYWSFWTGVEFAYPSDQAYTVKLDYVKTIPFMSLDADIPTIPQSFEELLMLGAKMRIYEQKEDFDYAGQFQNRLTDLTEAFVTRFSTRQVDNQMVVPGSRMRV